MNCIIIDDEPIARRGMRRLIEKSCNLTLQAELDCAEKAEEWLRQNSTDLIFLDIEMPGMNGIELARRMPRNMIIFTTAYSEYALEGFEVEAIDYLVKPVDPARFAKAVERAAAYKELVDEAGKDTATDESEFIIVKADRRYVRVRIDDIRYVEGLKDYVIIHLNDKRVVTRMTVKGMEEMLPRSGFMRVSKSYIVNTEKIESFDNNDVIVGSVEIPIGQAYREKVLDALMR